MTENFAKKRIRISKAEVLLSALMAAGLLFALFFVRGFYPFGSGSIALTDLYSQYLPLLYRFYDVVTGNKNLFMDPAIGGGVNLYADTINEVLNPFNYILLLFGRQRIWQSVNLLLVCYLAAAAATADLSLQVMFPDFYENLSDESHADISSETADASFNANDNPGNHYGKRKGGSLRWLYVMLAVCYGCSGYMAYNYQIIKWMYFPVLFPLFMVSFRRLMAEKKGGWYSILLAYQLVLNIQLGFMTLLFVFFGSAFYMRYLRLRDADSAGKNTAGMNRRTALLYLGISTLAGILLAGAVLVPSEMILLDSARSGELFSYLDLMKQTGASDIADRVFQIAHPVLLALLVTSWIRRIRSHRKADPAEKVLLLWILFLWLTVLLQPANLLWHMGSYMCFPVRYAYMILFSMICLIAQYHWSEKKRTGSINAPQKKAPNGLMNAAWKDTPDGYPNAALESTYNNHIIMQILQWIAVVCLCAAGLWASMHFAGRITQAFSSLVLTSCRKETMLVFGILALLFAAAFFAGKNRILQLFTALCAGACMFLFIFLPQDYTVRQMNEQAYIRLMQQYENSRMDAFRQNESGQEASGRDETGQNAEYSAFPTALMSDDDTLPRDAAMVNGTRSLTCYTPTLSKKTQQTLRNLGYEVYWTATSSKGGSALSEELLTYAHLLKEDENDNASDSSRVPFSVDSRTAVITVRIDDAEEEHAEEVYAVLQLPFIAVKGWHCRLNNEKAEIAETKDGLLGVTLVPGENLLEFRFVPPGLYAGLALSILGICVLLLQQRMRRYEELIFTKELDEHLAESVVCRTAGRAVSEKAGGAAAALFGILLTVGLAGIYILPFIGWTWNLAARIIPAVPSMEEVLDLSPLTADQNTDRQGVNLLKAVPDENCMRVYAYGNNMMTLKGVRVAADSQESKQFSADYVRDGITDDNSLRWSSLNDRENSEHWLAVRLPEKQPIGMVRIYWERCNANRYALEFSEDGENWTAVREFDAPAVDPVQDILLSAESQMMSGQTTRDQLSAQEMTDETGEYPETQYLRLHIMEVLQNEEDLTLYYQNVSVLEMEVYGAPSDVMEIDVPQIQPGIGRVLEVPELRHVAAVKPVGDEDDISGLSEKSSEKVSVDDAEKTDISGDDAEGKTDIHGNLTWIGADYPDLVDEEGNIQDTISDVPVKLGFALSYDGMRIELPEMETVIPASVEFGEKNSNTDLESQEEYKDAAVESEEEDSGSAMESGKEERTLKNLQDIGFAEWLPTGETELLPADWAVSFTASGKNADPEENTLAAEMAALFSKELDELLDSSSQQELTADAEAGSQKSVQIELVLVDPEKRYAFPVQNVCGDEGFNIDLLTDGDTIRIFANHAQGLRWGCVSLKHILEEAQESGCLESGWIRDYPRYKVRGFGIDAGRRAVSMDLLYDIMVALSDSRMNTLQIHLNDNEIISQSADSGYDGSMESARNLYAGYRLESEIRNADGVGITSEDLFYTKDAFRQLIEDARVYGVEIVPEIDMPAHSLAFTRVFPELGFTDNPESADELDLGKAGALEFARKLWGEYLTENNPGDPAAGKARNADVKGSTITEDTDGPADESAPVFDKCRTIHIGMDEYFGRGEDYITFLNNVAGSVSEMAPDKEIRIWGSLTYIGVDHSSVSRNLQMQIWDTQWTDPGQMYVEGFRLINSISSSLYIIPGGGYDYLNTEFLRDSWQPNIFATKEKTWKMPSCSPQILGAVYMLWNDHAQAGAEEISEEGLFDRFAQPLEILAEKLW